MGCPPGVDGHTWHCAYRPEDHPGPVENQTNVWAAGWPGTITAPIKQGSPDDFCTFVFRVAYRIVPHYGPKEDFGTILMPEPYTKKLHLGNPPVPKMHMSFFISAIAQILIGVTSADGNPPTPFSPYCL